MPSNHRAVVWGPGKQTRLPEWNRLSLPYRGLQLLSSGRPCFSSSYSYDREGFPWFTVLFTKSSWGIDDHLTCSNPLNCVAQMTIYMWAQRRLQGNGCISSGHWPSPYRHDGQESLRPKAHRWLAAKGGIWIQLSVPSLVPTLLQPPHTTPQAYLDFDCWPFWARFREELLKWRLEKLDFRLLPL